MGPKPGHDLEFFVTEPLETLVKKRASFLVSHHQHRDPAKWYNGLFSEWDMKTKVLRSPDDKDGMPRLCPELRRPRAVQGPVYRR